MSLHGYNGHDAASNDSLLADQPTHDYDINDIMDNDAEALQTRGAHNIRNNPHAVALVNAMQSGTVGPEGLKFRSGYNFSDDKKVNRDARKKINACIKRGTMGKRLDAAGLLSQRDIQDGFIVGKAFAGNSILVRVPAPQRPGAIYMHAWRTINPLRISNPQHARNTKTMRKGVALDANGTPYGFYIASAHPNSSLNVGKKLTWEFVPFYDSKGLECVIWHANRPNPEQIWGSPWFAPILGLLVQIGGVTQAHVVAKRLQACMGLVIESPNPRKAAASDRNGVVWTKDTEFKPGKNYYVKLGTKITPFDFKYNGADYENFTSALLQVVCAAFGGGIPYQYVLMQLTKSSLASARAALMQAWRTFRRNQIDQEHELRIIIKNIIAEDIARGRLVLPSGDDLDAACEGIFIPPERLSTDPHREMQGAQAKHETLGVSKTTLARENGGYDLEQERELRSEEDEADDELGLAPIVKKADKPADDEDEEIENDDENANENNKDQNELDAAA